MKDMFIAALPEAERRPETQIPIEKINGPILLLSGGDDHLWPSRQMADQMMARLKAKGFAHAYAHLTYDGAGHVVFVGAPDGAMGKVMGQPSAMLGGSQAEDAKAWADEWPKVLDFYAKALKGAR
jgi:dienelactone hydrolase